MNWLHRNAARYAFAAVMVLVGASAAAAQPQPSSKPAALTRAELRQGHAIAERYCSSCHAVTRTDKSHHPQSPPFRELSRRYPIDSLAESLAEGISVGHPDMPEIQLEPPQIHDFLGYLKSIQVAPKTMPAPPKLPYEEGVASFGRAYAEHACASCHAIAPSQLRSPNPNAPAFAAVADLPGMNSMALRAWLRTSHPTMPNLILTPARIDDLSAYMSTLRTKH